MRAMKWILTIAICALLGASVLIALWPATPAKPLITRNDWVISGLAYQNTRADPIELPDSMRNSPDIVYWRSWSPQTLATVADIRTKPFKPSTYMAIPYGGFAGDTGIRLNLVCTSNQETLPIASARTNTQTAETLLKLPEHWCTGDVFVEANSQSKAEYIEVGTPFSISWFDFYKSSFIGLIALFVLIFAAVFGCVFIPNVLFNHIENRTDSVVAGPIFLGIYGYLMFFIYFRSNHAGILISCLFLLAEAVVLYWYWRHRRACLSATWRHWKHPTALWILVAITAFCIAMGGHNGAGPWSVNDRFNPVRWSSDNQLPMQISEYLFHGHDPRDLSLGPWKVSDRPPLAYGLMASFRVISWLIASHRDGYALYFQYQLMTGIVINCLWVVALYFLLRSFRLDKRTLMMTILVVALTPFAIFNSVYIWPKMLGAAFGLFAFIKLFEPEQYLDTLKHERFGSSLVVAALLSALAMLSHGGTAFGVIASVLVAFWYRRLPTLGIAAAAAAVGLVTLLPWAIWQHLEQPPGNALVKYALAGTFGFEQEGKGVIATIRDAYAPLTPASWLAVKYKAAQALLAGQGSTCGVQELAPITSYFGYLRGRDFFYFGPSLRALPLGLIPLLFSQRFTSLRGKNMGRLHLVRVLIGTGLLSIGLYGLTAFDCYINHMQAYQSMLEILSGLALLLISARAWFFTLIAEIAVIYGIVVWIFDPLANSPHISALPVIVLCAVGLIIYWWFFSRRLSQDIGDDASR